MSYSGQDIRKIRQRLGWSLAEMARQMGCSTEHVSSWELGAAIPESETMNRLRYLSFHLESYSEQLSNLPLAEKEMEDRQMAQLTNREFLKDSL